MRVLEEWEWRGGFAGWNVFRRRADCFILVYAMAKPKKKTFSAAKAVKANARERVGQPKPSRILPDAPRTGRKAKHKTKMDELLRGDE
jgi:hypothetical protein